MQCKVSIIIRAYNCEKTIKRAMDSALSQNFSKESFEVLVVDDGSTDDTPKIIEGYNAYENLRVITQRNQGYVKAANIGFLNARGEWVVLLDDDDYFDENLLTELFSISESDPEASVVYSDYFEISLSDDKKLVSPQSIFEVTGGGVLIKRSKLEDEGFFNEDLVFPEYDLFLKTLGKWKVHHLTKPLFYYIRRDDSVTANKEIVKKGMIELKKLHRGKADIINKIRKY